MARRKEGTSLLEQDWHLVCGLRNFRTCATQGDWATITLSGKGMNPMAEQNQASRLPIGELRQRLLDEHARLEHELYELTSGDEAVTPADLQLDSGGMVSDQADDADDLSEVDRTRAIINHTQRLLTQVDEALARMDTGTYGICTNCGRPIAPARLIALPWAALCIDCQGKSERGLLQGGRSGAK